jgi:anti-sigma factor RsiW
MAMRYLDGELAPPQARAFEDRLGHEPALAGRVEELGRLDALAERALAGQTPLPAWVNSRTGRSRWVAAASVAAALAISVAASFSSALSTGEPRGTQHAGPGQESAVVADDTGAPHAPAPDSMADAEAYEAHFGQIWGIYDPQSKEIYLFEKTDRIQVGPRLERVGI